MQTIGDASWSMPTSGALAHRTHHLASRSNNHGKARSAFVKASQGGRGEDVLVDHEAYYGIGRIGWQFQLRHAQRVHGENVAVRGQASGRARSAVAGGAVVVGGLSAAGAQVCGVHGANTCGKVGDGRIDVE